MQQNKPVLIVAQSGRALAESAAKAGITTHVVDLFGDQDTCESAIQVLTVDGTGSEFDTGHLRTVLQQYINIPLSGVIVGSGLETDPSILDWITQHWQFFGNSAETVSCCKDPARFFPVLDSLDILHPAVRHDIPADNKQWLIKQTGGSGGVHVSNLDEQVELSGNYYLQEKISGHNYSVVFIANGEAVNVIGMSETWSVNPDHGNYVYAGAIRIPEPDENLFAIISNIIARLVPALRLKGLCGMDFIIDGDNKCYVLEVNPRPTSTFELHENKHSLLQAHITACEGKLIPEYKKTSIVKAHKIIYANHDLVIPAVNWPEWITDRPVAGKIVSEGMPVCTIQAEDTDTNVVKQLLLSRTKFMQESIDHYRYAA